MTTIKCGKCGKQLWPVEGLYSMSVPIVDGNFLCGECTDLGGTVKRQKVAVFDFDGVISTYKGWKGFDVFGEPIQATLKAMSDLHSQGWKVLIFTTRPSTPMMRKWLDNNGVVYDAINSTAHNPPDTSNKPIADVYIDDRAVNYHGQNAEQLLEDIRKVAESEGSPLEIAK